MLPLFRCNFSSSPIFLTLGTPPSPRRTSLQPNTHEEDFFPPLFSVLPLPTFSFREGGLFFFSPRRSASGGFFSSANRSFFFPFLVRCHKVMAPLMVSPGRALHSLFFYFFSPSPPPFFGPLALNPQHRFFFFCPASCVLRPVIFFFDSRRLL